jgi:hypothetical protein
LLSPYGFCRAKVIRTTYSECVSAALVIKHAKRMRHIFVCGVCLCHIFPHYIINCKILNKKNIKHKSMFDFLYLFSETFLILIRIQRDITNNVHRYSCHMLVILDMFQSNMDFLESFKKNRQISQKFFQSEPRCFTRTDNRADMMKLTVAGCNFAKAYSKRNTV